MSKADIYFVRHGATEYIKTKVIQGQLDRSSIPGIVDIPLLPEAAEHTDLLVNLIKENNLNPQIILSSPLLHTIQTTEGIAEKLGLEYLQSEALSEMFFGAEHEGMPVEDYKKIEFNPPMEFVSPVDGSVYQVKNGAELRDFHKSTDPKYDLLRHLGGESKKEVADRARKSLENFVAQHPEYERILVTTHNAALRFLVDSISSDASSSTVAKEKIVHLTYDSETGEWEVKTGIAG